MDITGELLSSLNRAGYSYSELAERHGLTRGKVAGLISRYKTANVKKLERFEVDLGEAWTLSGDWMVTGDLHVPCTDYDFLRLLLLIAKKHNIKRLLLAGDLFTQDGFSIYPNVVPPITWAAEREAARIIIHDWLEWFTEIRFLMGNHDRRMQKWAGGEFDECDIFGMITTAEQCHYSNWGWCVIDNPGGYPWRVTHSRQYSVNQLTVAGEMANKFQMNIISHHQHHLAKGWDKYKRFVVVDNGAMVDADKLAYVVLDDSKMPGMTTGFTMLKNGTPSLFGRHPFTDWDDALDNMV